MKNKEKEIIQKFYDLYYNDYFKKYVNIIDKYIYKYYPKEKVLKSRSMKEYESKYHSINESFEILEREPILNLLKSNSISKNIISLTKKENMDDIELFLKDLIKRRILVYEVRSIFYKSISSKKNIMECFKNKNDASKMKFIASGQWGEVYKIGSNKCIKIVNVTASIWNLKFINFLKEIEISKIAGNIDVGPKIYDAYCCVTEDNNTVYGIIYMEYLNGMTLAEYLDKGEVSREIKNKLKTMIEKKILLLHNHSILHSDLHRDNVFIIFKNENEIEDIKIIDYGFSQFINEYIYLRNHYYTNEDIFHFSREYIYNHLLNLIQNKLFLHR